MSNQKKNRRPRNVNREYFTAETFPKVIGFCDRDDSSFTIDGDRKIFTYTLNGDVIYELIKHPTRWELIEYLAGSMTCYSRGHCLQVALFHGLSLAPNYNNLMSDILVPVSRDDRDKALALMYYFGGYTGSWLRSSRETNRIISKFADSGLVILGFSKVPRQYLHWLGHLFVDAGITKRGTDRVIWTYNGNPESGDNDPLDEWEEPPEDESRQERGTVIGETRGGQAEEIRKILESRPQKELGVNRIMRAFSESLHRVWTETTPEDEERKEAVSEWEEFMRHNPQRWINLRTDGGLLLWREREKGWWKNERQTGGIDPV
ncbi:MAG: hypothetical protein JW736_04390 [Deltaproteobacteria bacterium]|nr:hypothetical protein [Deltaproteobacteria bacterium]